MIANQDVVLVASLETATALDNSRNSIFLEAISTTINGQEFVPLKMGISVCWMSAHTLNGGKGQMTPPPLLQKNPCPTPFPAST